MSRLLKIPEFYSCLKQQYSHQRVGFLTLITIICLLYYYTFRMDGYNPTIVAFPIRRILTESIMVILALFLLDRKGMAIFAILLISSLFHWELYTNIIWNIATIPLIVYASQKKIITSIDLAFVVKGTVIILLAFVLFNEANGFKVYEAEVFKNAGPFPSSLHLAYVLITISFLIFIEKSSTAHFFLLIIFFIAVLNGGRASFLFTGILFFLSLGKLPLRSKIAYCLIAIFFVMAFSIRSIGYEPGNDNVRLRGYINYLDNLSVSNFFVGEGRAKYGSIGLRAMGKENVLITESSMIMLLYCHGIFMFVLLVNPIFAKLYKLATLTKYNIIPVSLLFGLFLLVPFFDAIGIGVLNAFFLNQMFLNSKETSSD